MSYCVVSNIPQSYRSADLRKHFKQFIETGSFVCFHFRHRPEERKVADQADIQTFCCVIQVKEEQCSSFLETFHHKKWSVGDETGSLGVAVIIKTKINEEIKKLPELRPPKLMTGGNVGTPTATFFALVKKCTLPPNIIKKLGLEFPRVNKRKQYSAVNPDDLYDYLSRRYRKQPARATSSLAPQPSKSEHFESDHTNPEPIPKPIPLPSSSKTSDKGSFWSAADRADAHDGAEDWERHETFHNDVGTQDRAKDRLYEEDMEIVWDKGSSGLVFYTDGNYWADLEGKDTDGLWADEWDVDMAVYEGGPGDKDARDQADMRGSDQFKKHGDVEEQIGDFEKHTKGFGSRLMKKQGWDVGKGLGKTTDGRPEPVPYDGGQFSKDKTGLGYHGEIIYSVPVRENMADVIRRNNPQPLVQPLIGSKFDDVTEHKDSARRSEDPTAMKYRAKR